MYWLLQLQDIRLLLAGQSRGKSNPSHRSNRIVHVPSRLEDFIINSEDSVAVGIFPANDKFECHSLLIFDGNVFIRCIGEITEHPRRWMDLTKGLAVPADILWQFEEEFKSRRLGLGSTLRMWSSLAFFLVLFPFSSQEEAATVLFPILMVVWFCNKWRMRMKNDERNLGEEGSWFQCR